MSKQEHDDALPRARTGLLCYRPMFRTVKKSFPMPLLDALKSIAHVHLYLTEEDQGRCLRAGHAREAIQSSLDCMNNPFRHDILRYVVSPLTLTASALTIPCEPLTIAVDGIGGLAAKTVGYSLALVPASIGAVAGLFSQNPHHAERIGDNFLATLLLLERSARIPLQAVPVTLCLNGVDSTSAVLCGAARLVYDIAERQLKA